LFDTLPLPAVDDTLVLLKFLVATYDTSQSYHLIHTKELPTTSLDLSSSPTVTKMEIYGSGPSAHIYMGTESDVYRFPVQDCASHSTCCRCVSARDPTCGFDTALGRCVYAAVGSRQSLLQDLDSGNIDICRSQTSSPVSESPTNASTTATSRPETVRMCPESVETPKGSGTDERTNEDVTFTAKELGVTSGSGPGESLDEE
jgi:hypothetical protein